MTSNKIIVFFLSLSLVCSAQTPDSLKTAQTEAREDSLKLVQALKLQASFENRVSPDFETVPVESHLGDDAADDPAIWVNQAKPEKSLILGTNKKAGIYVYNLNGAVLQFVRSGKINNVDLRDNFLYKGKKQVLVAASNRSINAISLYIIDKETGLMSDTIVNIASGVDEVYGICMYHNNKNNRFYAIVNGKSGAIEQWEITHSGNQKGITATRVKSFSVATQPEGMVADDQSGMLFLGVEDEGIYQTNINADSVKLQLVEGSSQSNPAIAYDIEGLSLFTYKGNKYLIASVQGNFSYALFSIGSQSKYLTSFVILNGNIDGTEETDGLDLTTSPCGKAFPDGILVVQDGFNTIDNNPENQNFKVISFSKIIQFFH